MSDFHSFKRALIDCDYMHVTDVASGSRLWLPAAVFVIESIKRCFREYHDIAGAEELILPDLIRREDVRKLDAIYPISNKYLDVGEFKLAATHEAAFFSFAKSYISKDLLLDKLFMYNVGKMYRPPKKTNPPFDLGERACVLEAYLLFKGPAQPYVDLVKEMYGNIIDRCLHIPNIFVIRPRTGNLPFSVRTLSYEAILPVKKTLCCGMIYDQGSKFTKQFFNECSEWFSIHSGLTDYSVLSFLFSYFFEDGFDLPSAFARTQVAVIYDPAEDSTREAAATIVRGLGARGVRTSMQPANHTLSASKNALFRGARQAIALHQSRLGSLEIIKYRRGFRENISLDQAIATDPTEDDSGTIAKSLARALARTTTCRSVAEVGDAVEAGLVARCQGELSDLEVKAKEAIPRIGELVGFHPESPSVGYFIYSKRI